MKIKEGFWLREVGGAYVAVPLKGEARELSCIVNLNESGALLFRLLQAGATKEQMTDALLEAYDTDATAAAKAAEAFVGRLAEAGLLEACSA